MRRGRLTVPCTTRGVGSRQAHRRRRRPPLFTILLGWRIGRTEQWRFRPAEDADRKEVRRTAVRGAVRYGGGAVRPGPITLQPIDIPMTDHVHGSRRISRSRRSPWRADHMSFLLECAFLLGLAGFIAGVSRR